MCGITGGWSQSRYHELVDALPRMKEAIAHRGPDDSGSWTDAGAGIALGHQRLSILDTSDAGHQPMQSASGRWVIAFNGEIYNHLELRKSLARLPGSIHWRGHSDTETLLAGIEAWGLTPSLERSVGMFALALWDREERCLWLARDRFGEKPLYYGLVEDTFIFGSELKALRRFPGFSGAIDHRALSLYLEYGAVPSPLSIYENIFKLEPGCLLKVTAGELESRVIPKPIIYWDARFAATEARANPFLGSEGSAISALERRLIDSISGQMISDVPLGAFLSGGVDSSLVTALMQHVSPRPVKTFSIGFRESSHDEAKHAAAVAAHLGTEHTEFYVSPLDALALVPGLPEIYDEPFADSSQIPTAILSRLTRGHVTVALSGDGGDELFSGYQRYSRGRRLNSAASLTPALLRKATAGAIRRIPIDAWDRLVDVISALHPMKSRLIPSGDRLNKFATLIEANSPDERYRLLLRYCDPTEVLRAPPLIGAEDSWQPAEFAFSEWMMLIDSTRYLPNDILVKVDRAAMAVSLETRVPFLDHRVFELAWSLPRSMKEDGNGKHVLRQLLYQHVPRDLVDRPKSGFSVPLASWLRGPLKGWASDLLTSQSFRHHPLLDAEAISTKWREHQSGSRNWHYQLWTVLMYLSWQDATSRMP